MRFVKTNLMQEVYIELSNSPQSELVCMLFFKSQNTNDIEGFRFSE